MKSTGSPKSHTCLTVPLTREPCSYFLVLALVNQYPHFCLFGPAMLKFLVQIVRIVLWGTRIVLLHQVPRRIRVEHLSLAHLHLSTKVSMQCTAQCISHIAAAQGISGFACEMLEETRKQTGINFEIS